MLLEKLIQTNESNNLKTSSPVNVKISNATKKNTKSCIKSMTLLRKRSTSLNIPMNKKSSRYKAKVSLKSVQQTFIALLKSNKQEMNVKVKLKKLKKSLRSQKQNLKSARTIALNGKKSQSKNTNTMQIALKNYSTLKKTFSKLIKLMQTISLSLRWSMNNTMK